MTDARSTDPTTARPDDGSADNKGKAIAALVCGVLAGVVLIVPFVNLLSPVLAIAAIVLGAQAWKRANALGGANKGKAVTGVVFGVVSLVLFLLGVLGAAAFLSSDSGQEMLEEAEQSAPAVEAAA